MKLPQVLEDYHALAKKGAVIDYAFHMIIADPTKETLETDLPALIKQGHGSIKIFMTYDRLKIDDEPLLDILVAARDGGAMLCAHAENHGIISWMVKRLLARGYTAPKYHAISHARVSEAEAFNRLIGMAALIDQPIMIFHVSTAEGAKVIRDARGQGLKVFAETCPQYLFLTADDLDKPGIEGAKWMCSPPPRRAADQEALWQALVARRSPDRFVRSRALSLRRDRQTARRPQSELQANRERPAGPGIAVCRCCSTPWSRRGGSGSKNSSN